MKTFYFQELSEAHEHAFQEAMRNALYKHGLTSKQAKTKAEERKCAKILQANKQEANKHANDAEVMS